MLNRHSYIACVREGTRDLPDIDAVKPFGEADETCLQELNEVLRKHGATSRFGVNLLHSHFQMGEDEVLLEETDIENRKQTISVIKKSQVPAGAIYMDRRFDVRERQQALALFDKMGEHRSDLLINKLRSDLSLSAEDAIVLVDDVKRFLALCLASPQPLAPPRVVDQGWHQFILCTKDYAKFCDEICGRFVHHEPADPYTEAKDFGADRRRTRELAEAVFGTLSANWDEYATGGRCTHNCGNEVR